MFRLLAVLVCVTVVAAQIPLPCVTPSSWEARASSYDHGEGTSTRYRISYDAPNLRRRILEEVDAFTPGRRFFEYLELGAERREYVIDIQYRHCEVLENQSFKKFEIPPNATFEGAYTIGFGAEGFEVHEWSDRGDFGRFGWIGGFTAHDCAPVSEAFFRSTNITNDITVNYYDVTAGISDPNIFIPPVECR